MVQWKMTTLKGNDPNGDTPIFDWTLIMGENVLILQVAGDLKLCFKMIQIWINVSSLGAAQKPFIFQGSIVSMTGHSSTYLEDH